MFSQYRSPVAGFLGWLAKRFLNEDKIPVEPEIKNPLKDQPHEFKMMPEYTLGGLQKSHLPRVTDLRHDLPRPKQDLARKLQDVDIMDEPVTYVVSWVTPQHRVGEPIQHTEGPANEGF